MIRIVSLYNSIILLLYVESEREICIEPPIVNRLSDFMAPNQF